MRIQLLSDLHLEHHRDGGRSFLESLDPSGVDLLVVAGDLHDGERGLVNSLLSLCALYPWVVFVVGNHEYYGWMPRQVHRRLTELDRDVANLHWLHHEARDVEGLRIAGTPLWFPKPSNPLVMLDRYAINDFNVIKGFEPWVYDENRRAMEFLQREAPRADIIVTHHVPTVLATSARFKTDTTNHYFITDVTRLIQDAQPKLWCFGHTHDRQWLRIDETLLACNPFGYPFEQGVQERGYYAENCLIDVDSDGARFACGTPPGWPYPGPMQAGSVVVAAR